MPTLTLKTSFALATPAAARAAAALTDLTARCLGKRAEVTAVMVESGRVSAWTIGGEVAHAPTAWLEIDITAGTNSAAQKAAFIEAAYGVMAALAANEASASEGLALASYVIVRELPATDWGYGGRTQQARQAERIAAI